MKNTFKVRFLSMYFHNIMKIVRTKIKHWQKEHSYVISATAGGK